MSGIGELLDPVRVRELFDLRGSYISAMGGNYTQDPYPVWKELREQAPVHEGTLHGISGITEPYFFHGLPFPDRPHYTALTYATCNEAYRAPAVFSSSPEPIDPSAPPGVLNSLLAMGGDQHRRYRELVQPSFVPAQMQWWMRNWMEQTVTALIDAFEANGRAELNVEFCAAIPVLTITGSFGIPIHQALDVRAAMGDPERVLEVLRPIVAERRAQPQDDLISVLVQAELRNEDGTRERLSDAEIYSFALLLLVAGSGTTWKQMGIVLTALLHRPELLQAVREDRELLRPVVEETLRWQPTDPMFSRWVTEDTELGGVAIPKDSVVHLSVGAANRDPARWDRPEEFDPYRTRRASLAFGSGPHTCLGMHVARAEMHAGINALLDRLPTLRLDPDQDPPSLVGFYERGATTIPVVFD